MENSLEKVWGNIQLEELLTSLESGSRPKGGVRGITNGIPSVGGEHINDEGSFNFLNVKYVPIEFAAKMNRGQIKSNDILIVKDGATTGRVAFVEGDFPFEKAVVNEHVFICRVSKELNPKYVFFFLLSKGGQDKVLNNFKGSAQGGINSEFMSNTLVPLAPLSEQHRIVAKLEAIMQKLESNKQRLAKVAQFEYKIFLKNIFDGPEFYTTIKLDDCCKEQTKSIGKDWANHRLIGVSKDKGVVDLRTGGKKTFERYKIVKPGWFLYNPMRVDIGSIAIWDGNEIALTSPDYVVFSIDESISPNILLKFLKSNYGLSEINNNTQGAVRSRLYFRNLAKINFPFSGEQNHKNAELLFKGFNKLSKRKNHIEKIISKLQQSIFEKAFRGELVPQDPNDEPASVLLERIKKEKGKLKTKKTKVKK